MPAARVISQLPSADLIGRSRLTWTASAGRVINGRVSLTDEADGRLPLIRPSRTHWTISPSWAIGHENKVDRQAIGGAAPLGPAMITSVPLARITCCRR
jgi:hypothetical protein